MKYLFAVVSLLAVSVPVQAETIYLIIKSDKQNHTGGLALHSIPMETMDQCEEAGALLIASDRFDSRFAKDDGFECLEGK